MDNGQGIQAPDGLAPEGQNLDGLVSCSFARFFKPNNKRRYIMSIVKWKNRNELLPALNMADWAMNFFKDDDFFDKRWLPGFEMTTPSVNVKETKEAYKLEVAAPGMKKDDFKVEIKEGHLCIAAETKSEKEEKEENFTRKEFNYQAFSRSFWLPENVKADSIKATYNDGILKIEVPKVKVEKEEPAKVVKVS